MRPRQLAGAAAAIACVAAVAGCTPSASTPPPAAGLSGRGPITFMTAADPSGGTDELVQAWNNAHPDEKVTLLEQSSTSDQAHTALAQNFQARSDRVDVARINSVWTPEFAARGWIAEIPASAVDTSAIMPAPLSTGRFNGKTHAIPWFTDAGLLYYRTDLVSTPPKTWAELKQACAVAKANNIGCYAGQFAKYDGLTVNVSEAVASAGGSVVDAGGTKATLNTPEALEGVKFLVESFRDGTIPKAAITYQEEDSRKAFMNGELLFLRNWPYVYNLASKPGEGNKVAGKVGMAPIPGRSGAGKPALGGWNLAVSSYSKHQETAADFVEYLVAPQQQRLLLTKLGLSPVLAELYKDAALLKQYPYLEGLAKALDTAVPLPQSTNWAGLSLAVQESAYAALQGSGTAEDAVAKLQTAVTEALARQ
ncbi:ABC transporter substrate-binding protein [Dactylosporangium sp. AC04546]|uniref:ABC transporter substrate-binding protein n=1 Tax=Dactylosporangium sp. AC04546 TaxID=2862460 RepID=UPI001EDE773E|nr:ABC transporter substrate-binding protein [Dactylosporangium sp. AC04546]WVK81187.1 ABC transporter substrate-binding protein [Dactylosporangium sp. AC04546]